MNVYYERCHMKRTGSALAIAASFSLMGLGIAQAGDVMEIRPHVSFDKIIIDDTGVAIDVKVGKDFSVILRGSEKWISRMTTKTVGNALVIGEKNGKMIFTTLGDDNLIIITMPKFTALQVEGAVDAAISGVDSEKLGFELNGAGNIEVEGSCGALTVEMNGAGNFSGEDLKCENVKIAINGAGNVEVYGSETADLDINGMGNIDLYGNPKKVTKDKSWFSNITLHED